MRVYRAADLELERVVTLPRASDALPEGVQFLASPSIAPLTDDQVAVLDRDRLSWWRLNLGRPLADPLQLPTDLTLSSANRQNFVLARPGHRGQVIVDTHAELAIWDLAHHRQIAVIPTQNTTWFADQPGPMAVNKTGSRLAVRNTERNQIDQWNLDTLQPLPSIQSDAYQVIGFSSDLLVLSLGGDPIQLWRADTPTLLGEAKTNLAAPWTVELHNNTLVYNTFNSPESGTYVMETTRLPLDPQAWFHRLCQINNRDFTTVEQTRLPQNANRTRPCGETS